jgi:hypothetical protein
LHTFEKLKALIKKFFPFDKNYLLEQAQLHCRETLLLELVEKTKVAYEQKINPLGLLDSFAAKIRNTKPKNIALLFDLYDSLAAVYRFKFGDNQLEFLWDGTDHLNYYTQAWTSRLDAWTSHFCQHELFIQTILDLTIFLSEDDLPQLWENRLNHFIAKHLDVKFHKTKGILAA